MDSQESSPTHSSKASVLWHSAFFMVQLSHPYMTTGKTIALIRWIFVGKVMSLLFNMLPRLVIAFLPRSKRLLISRVCYFTIRLKTSSGKWIKWKSCLHWSKSRFPKQSCHKNIKHFCFTQLITRANIYQTTYIRLHIFQELTETGISNWIGICLFNLFKWWLLMAIPHGFWNQNP